MSLSHINSKKIRKSFGKIPLVTSLPNLVEVQKRSFDNFLQLRVSPEKKEDSGLHAIFKSVFPINDYTERATVDYVSFDIGVPKYDVDECSQRGMTYGAPLLVNFRLIIWDIDEIAGTKSVRDIKEQEVYMGDIPLMTKNATFVVNGTERVVVSQIVRSPGVFFGKTPQTPYYAAKIIPKRGAWLEVETDKKGVISVKIDRKRKIPVTALLRIFGYESDDAIKELFKDEITSIEQDYIHKTLEKDPSTDADSAYQLVYKRIRPGDLATVENAKNTIDNMFFDYKKYDMGAVARFKINKRFDLDIENKKENHTFKVEDFVLIMKHLLNLNNGNGKADDIDDLSNRRIRAVGELVQNKFRIGLLRTERIAKDRMTVSDLETVTPTQLVNSRPITAALREHFANSQLSQFMDQTNPLSELAHKRRISAMGPGGLSRERASFEVRDVHPTHYGRICPIATPEGPNIGLVVHLATHGVVNEFGFIETPFKKVLHTIKNKKENLIGRIPKKDILDGKKVIAKADEVINDKTAAEIAKLKDKEIEVRPYMVDETILASADDDKRITVAQANTEIENSVIVINDKSQLCSDFFIFINSVVM